MRKDMSKVVTERPRVGHWLPSRKTRMRIHRYDPDKDYDDLPKRISGSRSKHVRTQEKIERGRDVKEFSDLIGPLQRFLRGNVGRPWDEVFSEMKQTLDSRKVTGNHVFEHVRWEVELHPVIGADGYVYKKYPHYRESRLSNDLYVDPRTGLLCWAEQKPKRKPQPDQPDQPEKMHIPRGKNCGYFKLDGIWHFIRFKARWERQEQWVVDHSQRRWVLAGHVPEHRLITLPNGKEMEIVSQEPLSRQERVFAGLRNDPHTAGNRMSVRE